MGDLEAQSTKSQTASYQLLSMFAVLLLAMSALTVYVAIINSENAQKIEDLQNLYLGDRFEQEEDMVTTKQTIRAARSADGSSEECNSEFYPNFNVTPSAHLVGSDSMLPSSNTSNGDLITWKCNAPNAHVVGGMKTDLGGHLVVPVQGIYYIYVQFRIQVIINVTGHSGQHGARMKKLSHNICIRRGIWNSVMERYESLNYEIDTYQTTDYYGGLHFLKAGDAIAVTFRNPCHVDKCGVQVVKSTHDKSNFFGAFWVTHAAQSG